MKAAVVRAFNESLRIEDRPIPTPSAGQVLVKMETCGLCHTDIHAAHGDWPVKPSPPFVPGHEGVGIVTPLVRTSEVSSRGIEWRSHGSGTPAARVNIAPPAERRSAPISPIPDIAWMERTRNTPWPTLLSWAGYRPVSTLSMPPR